MSFWLYIFSFGIAFLTSLVGARLLIAGCDRFGVFLDTPDERRLHRRPVGRCGGIAVFLGYLLSTGALLSLPLFQLLNLQLEEPIWSLSIQVGGWLLLVGLLDDAWGLRWYSKLIAQIAAGAVMFLGGLGVDSIGGVALPEGINLLVTIGWYVVFINAMNLIDGLDGLASGLAISGALGLGLLALFLRTPGDAVLLAGFIGACGGFLYFNFHPARIFLGDSGSMFLGFTLASFGLGIGGKTTAVAAFIAPIVAVGVPFFDALLAVWRRSARALLGRVARHGERVRISQADMDHLHHRLVRLGLSQRRVAILLYLASLALVIVGALSLVFHERAGAILFLALIGGIYVVVRHICHTELWDSGALVAAGFARPKGKVVATIVLPLLDVVVMVSALAFTDFLLYPHLAVPDFKVLLFGQLPVWVGIPFLGLIVSQAYARVWSRARISEFVLLTVAFLGGCSVAFGIEHLQGASSLRASFVHGLIYSGVGCFFVLGLRSFPRAFQDILAFVRGGTVGPEPQRVLLYGAGSRCQLFIRRSLVEMFDGRARRIVGIVDDDPNLRKRLVLGHRVVGVGGELARLLDELQVSAVVLLCTLPEATFAATAEICREKGVALSMWRVDEVPLVDPHHESEVNEPPQGTPVIAAGIR
jgi:UDP-N-acetylmuramyl pentapeptide phosphotransferase/UDP-N-acetylglucosamine-1-phosphate transferase